MATEKTRPTGRHVRIPESALDEFITAGTFEPVRLRTGGVA